MLARVKQTCRWNTVTAFAGREYIRNEWRRVPAGLEAEAQRHPMLDIDAGAQPEQVAPAVEPARTKDELKALAKEAGIPNSKFLVRPYNQLFRADFKDRHCKPIIRKLYHHNRHTIL